MKAKKSFSTYLCLNLLLIATLMAGTAVASNRLTVLHQFRGKPAKWPVAGLSSDAQGNLYGVATQGGPGNGVVFELMPTSKGWQYHVLYQFKGGRDGSWPLGGVILDQAGNIFGTTSSGGGSKNCEQGCGTVFELSPTSSGWKEEVLYRFNGKTGALPEARLVMDSAGNLYGTTTAGGSNRCGAGCGTVFELSPSGAGWAHKILNNFTGENSGVFPRSPLILDAAGHLYGTTVYGSGLELTGTAFELSPGSQGRWRLATLVGFGGENGSMPVAGLVFDGQGSLYGTTQEGGTSKNCSGGCGVVFKLSPSSNGWTEQVLYNFTNGKDGSDPISGLIFDTVGNLYGTAAASAGSGSHGTVYKMTPNAGGSWNFAVLHRFTGGSEGGNPVDDLLLMDSAGNLYGTTGNQGKFGFGTVFRVAP